MGNTAPDRRLGVASPHGQLQEILTLTQVSLIPPSA
jgi:hypothetical protein